MGGNALKSTYTRRCDRKEFDLLSKELIIELKKTFSRADTPLFYEDKESFGDIDIIVDLGNFDKSNLYNYVKNTFNPNEIFVNDNSYSFDYKEMQVDLIVVKSEYYNTNYHYLAYNDLGNFIGRIAQKLGVRYGQEGLWYTQYIENQKYDKIILSKDYRDIFNFLGFDYNKWLEGFKSLNEIFEYVCTSKYFDSNIFNLENLNRINRERNAKRKNYVLFLEFVQKNYPNIYMDFPEFDESLKTLNKIFPNSNLIQHASKNEYEFAKIKYANSIFNGKKVIDRYGYQNKELGEVLKGFKEHVLKFYKMYGNYHEIIIKMGPEHVFDNFETYLKVSGKKD